MSLQELETLLELLNKFTKEYPPVFNKLNKYVKWSDHDQVYVSTEGVILMTIEEVERYKTYVKEENSN